MTTTVNSTQKWTQLNIDQKIGLVPTMGALHQGHMSLIHQSKKENDITVVSIFVNPTQFNKKQDLKSYPKDLERDLALLCKAKVDYLFAPDYDALYPYNYRYKVSDCKMAKILCGANRPGHFDGVLSVVMKLLNIIKPTNAYFGEKDYQQYILIKDMVQAFFMDVNIIPCPTVREVSGLAMSSRNLLLTPEQLEVASSFYHHLKADASIEEIKTKLTEQGFVVDYIEEHFGRRFGAIHYANVRLIDNVEV